MFKYLVLVADEGFVVVKRHCLFLLEFVSAVSVFVFFEVLDELEYLFEGVVSLFLQLLLEERFVVDEKRFDMLLEVLLVGDLELAF